MTAFKIGSVYRDEAGYLIALANPSEHGYRWPNVALAIKIEEGGAHYGSRRLSDGVCSVDESPCYRLIPGELHQVNGQWVPVEEKKEETELERAVAHLATLVPKAKHCPSCGTLEGFEHGVCCELLMPVGPNAAMIARDDTDDARHYAKKRAFIQKCRDLAAERAAKESTALPANAALTRMSGGDHKLGASWIR